MQDSDRFGTKNQFATAELHAFGAGFDALANDVDTVNGLLAGRLTLNPHPIFRFNGTIDWRSDPFEERNWRAQLHMLRWLDPIRRSLALYEESERARNVTFWLNTVKSWAQRNADSSTASDDAWIDMVDAFRLKTLIFGLPMIKTYLPEEIPFLIQLIEIHGDWLTDPEHLGHSNHALHQHVALFLASRILERTDWEELSITRLMALFEEQYDEEGINAEGALTYHQLNYRWWKDTCRHLEIEEVEIPEIFHRLEKVPEELAHATAPTGYFAALGDTDNGNAKSVAHPYTNFVTTKGSDGVPPPDLVKLYQAGYLFARSGWGEHERDFEDETFWAVPFGSNNKVHGHHDGGSLSFTSMGVDWIVDPGKYAYNSSAMSKHVFSREAHSLISITGTKPRPNSNVELKRFADNEKFVDASFVDSSYPTIELSRRYIYSKSGEYLVIVDVVRSDEDVTATQGWQLGVGVTAEQTAKGFELHKGDATASILFTGTSPSMSSVTGSDAPLDGWVSTGWNRAEPATRVSFTKSGKFFRFITVISAGYKGKIPTITTEKTDGRGAVQIFVDTGRMKERIRFDSTSVTFPERANGRNRIKYWPSEPSSDPAPIDPTDLSLRAEIFDLVTQLKAQSWRSSDPQERLQLAKGIGSEFASYGPNAGFDCGIRSAIADLVSDPYSHVSTEPVSRVRFGALNWDHNEKFRAASLRVPVRSFDDTEVDLTNLPEGDSVLSFDLGGLSAIAAINNQPGDILTVVFHGALDRGRTQLPMFQRYRFQKEMAEGPVLAFSDPTLDLHENIRLGWYIGTERIDLASKIAQVTRKVARQLGTPHVVLQGSSGGGFTALQVGSFLPEAHVVALNPQTDLREYLGNFANTATISAFGRPIDELPQNLVRRVSVISRYAEGTGSMNATIVSNPGDRHHLDKHVNPVFDYAKNHGMEWNLNRVVIDLGPGHLALNNEQYETLMRSIYQRLRD